MKTDAVRSSSVARADELFAQHRQQIYRSTDRLFERLMIVQWLAGIVAAFVIAPRTWSGQMSHIHIHVWGAILIGGAISAFPIWMIRMWPGTVLTRHVLPLPRKLMAALW